MEEMSDSLINSRSSSAGQQQPQPPHQPAWQVLEEKRQQEKKENNKKSEKQNAVVRYFSHRLKKLYRYLVSMNFVVVFATCTSLSCLLFALLLFAIGPEVTIARNVSASTAPSPPSNNNSNNNTNNTSTTTFTSSTTTTTTTTTTTLTSFSTTPAPPTTAAPSVHAPPLDHTGRISFLDALFISTSAFSATGLASVEYHRWSAGALALISIIITCGSTVLLTTLPAILRYRELSKERDKLIEILEATGAYDTVAASAASSSPLSPPGRGGGGGGGGDDQELATVAGGGGRGGGNSQNQTAPSPGLNLTTVLGGGTAGGGGVSRTARERSRTILRPSSINGGMSPAAALSPRDTPLHPNSSSVNNRNQHQQQNNNNSNNNRNDDTDSLLGGGSGGSAGSDCGPGLETASHDSLVVVPGAAAAAAAASSFSSSSPFNNNHNVVNGNSNIITAPQAGGGAVASAIVPRPSAASTSNSHNNSSDDNGSFSAAAAAVPPPCSPTGLTEGRRIVFEDGLASVNQQIDVCEIIIFGAISYWFFVHLFFIILVVCSGRGFGWAVFHVVSAFNNAGFALAADSMMNVSTDIYLMLVFSVLMPLGGPLYPVAFRCYLSFVHWILDKCTPSSSSANNNNSSENQNGNETNYQNLQDSLQQQNNQQDTSFWCGQSLSEWKHSLGLLLAHPRRHYTHLFSRKASTTLFLFWLTTTIIGLLLLIPELEHDGCLAPGVGAEHKFFIGLMQSIAVRTTGFNVIDLSAVSVGHLTWWILAMLVAQYPFIFTLSYSSAKRGSHATFQSKSKLSRKKGRGGGENDLDSESDGEDYGENDAQNDGNDNSEDDEDDESSSSSDSDSENYNVNSNNNDEEATSVFMTSPVLRSAASSPARDLATNNQTTTFQMSSSSSSNNNNNNNIHSTATSSPKLNLKQSSSSSQRHQQNSSKKKQSVQNFVHQTATEKIARDILILYTALLIITYSEQLSGSLPADQRLRDYSIYLRSLFEICSAFGNVGLSLGPLSNPGVSYTGNFSLGISVFTIIVIMLFGKHRQLPSSLDEAAAIHVRDFSVDFASDASLDPDADSKRGGKNLLGSSSSSSAALVSSASFFYDPRRRERFILRVKKYLSHYNPSRVELVPRMVDAFASNPRALMKNLVSTYGRFRK